MINIKIITKQNVEYPKQLLNIKNEPQLLYTKGNLELLNTTGIAIIGSRACTNKGKEIAKKFAKELAIQGITIISGMAKGIDTAAHEGALEVKGKTIAVLGCGLNNIFPKENEELFKKIIENNGLVISEYPMEEEAQYKYFLERNRIVSGLSIGILVIEAHHRSGTSVTATFAVEQGRKIFCIPHNLDDKNGIGTNRLIKEGANLVTNIEDIINEFPFLEYDPEKEIKYINKTKYIVKNEYKEIFNTISSIPIEKDEICNITNKNMKEVNSTLFMLEMEGVIKKVAGGYICT